MEKLAIGQIRTSHGLKGYLKVRSYSGEVEHFLGLKTIELRLKGRRKEMVIEDISASGDLILMKFQGISTPEEAKMLNQFEIWVDRDKAAPLKTGEFYQADLHACDIVYNDVKIGVVQSVIEANGRDMLEVKKGSETYMLPFQEQFIGDVNLEEKTIELLTGWILNED